ncbi:hypothetical protein [Vibrio cholerae]|uniref:hypothetical protein n=1 Tax=Vibrio cholerae TaxID=666 RepID=UPI0014851CDE|nr:hypothetical protein [Vibrio cholerae]
MNKALEENIVQAVFDTKIRKAMLAELRQRHERADKGLYFPLSRHGDYWIDFADENVERHMDLEQSNEHHWLGFPLCRSV